MSVGNPGRVGVAASFAGPVSLPAAYARRSAAGSSGLISWVLLIGIFTPALMTIYIGGTKFTPARIVICLLLLPAILELTRKGRRWVAADFFAVAASAWMIGVTFRADAESLSSATAMVLEFFGGYVVARGCFVSRPALEGFLRAFKIVAIAIIALALLEHLTRQVVLNNLIAGLWGMPTVEAEYRHGMPRAFSTFPHPILYGTYCVVAGAVLMYCARSSVSRLLFGAFCLLGCFLALSSAPLMSFVIVIAIFFYDRLLHGYSWRWCALTIAAGVFLCTVFLVANKPVSWIVANLTLDPATGYFRVATWDSALYYIGLSPWFGYGFESYADSDDYFGNASVDSVWLVLALRFGVPLVVLIALTNITAFYPSGSPSRTRNRDPQMSAMRTGFTLALFVFMFTGLTVHYWNNIWIFWGVCVGVRAALKENDLGATGRAVIQDHVWHARIPVRESSWPAR